MGYKLPFDFNRLSLHPRYKWITGHIGNVNMMFSPYTLSGHQFTGGGVELTPPGNFKISAMSGRLLRATEDDGDPRTLPAFTRMGYGLKTSYEQEKFTVGVIGFYAKDDITSISQVPEERGILPKENLVLSINGDVQISQDFSLQAEYASTAITKDLRAEENDTGKTGIASMFFNNRTSTEYYSAVKAGLNYVINRTVVGVGYERIDPGYETLGAYFFNNDLENITLNTTTTMFKDKLSLTFNVGYQRDDLKNLKANNTNRILGSVNSTFILSEKVNITGSYSNFSTYTNVKPNQFDDINDENLLDNEIEEFNYRQLSQTANLNVNWILQQEETSRQNLNINYNLNDIANEQDGVVRVGEASTFHNINTAYTIGFPQNEIDITSAINYTYNTIGMEDATTWGPTLSVGKRFFNKSLNSMLAISYNETENTAGKTTVSNLRGTLSYVLKEKHNFNLNAIQLFRSGGTNPDVSEFTATFGYNYVFGIKKPSFSRNPKIDKNLVKLNYKDYYFEGTPTEVTQEINALDPGNQKAFMVNQKKADLELLIKALQNAEKKSKKEYKETAIVYLDALFEYEEFLLKYDQWIFDAYLKLIFEAEKADRDIQSEFETIQSRVNTYKRQEDIDELALIEKKHTAHRVMLSELRQWDLTMEEVKAPTGELKKLKETLLPKIYVMFKNNRPENKIIDYIEVRLADLYHKEYQGKQ